MLQTVQQGWGTRTRPFTCTGLCYPSSPPLRQSAAEHLLDSSCAPERNPAAVATAAAASSWTSQRQNSRPRRQSATQWRWSVISYKSSKYKSSNLRFAGLDVCFFLDFADLPHAHIGHRGGERFAEELADLVGVRPDFREVIDEQQHGRQWVDAGEKTQITKLHQELNVLCEQALWQIKGKAAHCWDAH